MNRQLDGADAMSGVGATIARERAMRSLSIDELAQRASISAGLISQLERGIGNPSLSTLLSLANTLHIPVGAFFQGAGNDEVVVHPATRRRLVLNDRQLTYQLLVPDLQGSLSMLYIELPPRFSNEDQPFTHPGEEAAFVLEGRLHTFIGDRTFELNPGDSMRFNPRLPHWYRTGDESVVVITAMTPPSF